MNHEKEVLAEIARQHGIEWEQKGTHEEHLDVYNFKKKERKKEVQELEQKKADLTVENEDLTSQISEARADVKLLEDEKKKFQKEKEVAEKHVEKVEQELKGLEERKVLLQPLIDNVNKEIKAYGMIRTFLPEAGAFERAIQYRENKIKPLFTKMKNQIAALAGMVVELSRSVEHWKHKYQEAAEECDSMKTQLYDMWKENQELSGENKHLQRISDRYNRVVRVLGTEVVDGAIWQDVQNQKELEEKQRLEAQQHKKKKSKYRGMEI